MKKLLALFTALILFSFVSCSSNASTEDTSSAAEQTGTGVEESSSTPVSDSTPEETEPPVMEEDAFIYKYVVVLGVDGAGAFFQNTDTPNLDRIFENGSVAYDVTTSTPSSSAPCWGSMLIGVEANIHRLTNAIVAARPYDTESIFPSVFRVVRENDPDCELASFTTWNPINIGIIEDNLGIHKDTAENDAALTMKICDYLDEHSPKLLFIQFDNVDGAGHGSGYGEPTHLKQITTTDGYINRVYKAYEEKGILEDTLFIVTSDHGGMGNGHGGDSDAEMHIMYALAGKTVQENGAAVDMQVRDNAAIVLHAFGYDVPETWTAIVPTGVFEGVTAGERPVYEIQYAYEHRTHENADTPAKDGGKYVTDFLGDRVISYINMDNDVTDQMGTYTTELNGKLYFEEGYYGKAARFDDGYVSLKNYKPGKNSFTVALWFKANDILNDPCLVSNKSWESGKNPGFVLSLRPDNVKFNLGNKQDRMDTEWILPIDFRDGWVHVILTVDREANTIGFCYDFGELQTTSIPAELADASFSAYNTLNIGQDGTGKYYTPLPAVIDEFLLIDGALSQEDVAALAEYYNAK